MSAAPVDFRSLKSKILLPLLLAGTVLCLMVLWGIYLTFQDSLTDKLRQRAELVANMVNYAAESISRAGELQRIVTTIGADKDVLEIIVVAGNPQRVIASTEFVWLGKPLTDLPKQEVADDLLKAMQTRAPHSHFNDNQHLFDFSSPLLLSQSSLAKSSLVEGAIMVHLDTSFLQAEILHSTQVFSAIFFGALILLTIFGYLLLQRFVLHPIAVINNLIEEAAASHDIAWGKTDTHDEIGLLAHTLRDLMRHTNMAITDLLASEKYLRTIVDAALDAVITMNDQGLVTDWNPVAEQIFGYSRANAVGKPLESLIIPPPMREMHQRGLEHFLKTGVGPVLSKRIEITAMRAGGGEFPVEMAIVAIRSGENFFFNAFLRDISARKQAEEEIRQLNVNLEWRVLERTSELQAVNQELEAFSYSVSHDLRAPLRSIDGFSQALLEDYADKLDDQGKDYLNRVRGATQRMGHLIDDMLALSRITHTQMRRETVDLSALATDVLAELQKSEPERKVDWHIEPDLIAVGDERLLRMALVNLLGNAWKFTGKTARAKIEFGATSVPDTGNAPIADTQGAPDVVQSFFVRDNGAGYDMTYADKLFGAFQRLHLVSDFPGTGIGLATVQRIVNRHGGRVWTEGAVGKGATFYFTL